MTENKAEHISMTLALIWVILSFVFFFTIMRDYNFPTFDLCDKCVGPFKVINDPIRWGILIGSWAVVAYILELWKKIVTKKK